MGLLSKPSLNWSYYGVQEIEGKFYVVLPSKQTFHGRLISCELQVSCHPANSCSHIYSQGALIATHARLIQLIK